jgi:type IV secretory pathway VirB10-like protein
MYLMAKSKELDPFDLTAGVPQIEGALRPTPKFADRISKRVLYLLFALVGFAVVIFLVSLDNMDQKKKKPLPEKEVKKGASSKDAGVGVPKELFGAVAMSGGGEKLPSTLAKPAVAIAPEVLPAAAAGKPGAVASEVPSLGAVGGVGMIPKDTATGGAAVAPLTPAQQAANLEKQMRATRMAQARAGGMIAKSFDGEDATAGGAAGGAGAKITDMLMGAAKNAGAAGQAPAAPKGGGEQDEKLDFVKNAEKESRGYHPHIALAALSPNEVKTGSYIPMALEQGINSDLPGQITARVTEDVYDTISGCRILIPAMSKAVGRYDSKVALGQSRMLVVWNTIVFPDGAELNLAGMQGYDTSGQSGLESNVDNHYLRLFGLTLGMSLVTAGTQLAVPQPNPGVNGAAAAQTPAQTVATALAQQYGQLGAQILGKYMAVQPTLRNFAGERFIVMVPRTIVFGKVWRNRCVSRPAM